MTIPALMAKYHKHIVETRLKRTYSVIAQAIKIAEENYGNGFGPDTLKNADDIKATIDVNGYSYELSHATFEEFLKSSIKTIHQYPKNTIFNIVYGNTTTSSSSVAAVYDLLDGTRIIFTMRGTNLTSMVFGVIPQPNKENKYIAGRDFFEIEFSADNGFYEYKPFWFRCWNNGQSITKEKLVEFCGSSARYVNCATAPQAFCFHLIKTSGYEIPSNYPYRF